jgi:hypothetical protein
MKSRKKQGARPKASLAYEEVATYLLKSSAKEFGLKFVEGKQKLQGASGALWEIDAKGVREDNDAIVVVECRRYTTSKLKQEDVGGLAFRIADIEAEAGIIVSPLGLQAGAAKVAAANNIISVKLNAESTLSEFAFQFLDKLRLGITGKVLSSARVTPRLIGKCEKCGKDFEVSGDRLLCNDCDPSTAV